MSKYDRLADAIGDYFDKRHKDSIYSLARRMSESSNLTWFVLTHPKRDSVTCTENDLYRLLKQGFKHA